MARQRTEDPAREAWAIIAGIFLGDEMHDRFHDACQAIGVTPPALKALMSLEPDEPRPMRALATSWRCDASWVTSLVDTLEELGLVERRMLPSDRRVKTVALTPAGIEAKAKALDVVHQPHPPAASPPCPEPTSKPSAPPSRTSPRQTERRRCVPPPLHPYVES